MIQYSPEKLCPGRMDVAPGHPANVLVAGSVVQGLVPAGSVVQGLAPCRGGERGTSPRTTFPLCTLRLEPFIGQHWLMSLRYARAFPPASVKIR